MEIASRLLREAGPRLRELEAAEDALLKSEYVCTSNDLDEARKRKVQAEESVMALALALDAVVGPGMMDKALTLCKNPAQDRNGPQGVRKFVSQGSKRVCYHVTGVQAVYLCVEGFCSCRDFVSKVESSEIPLCKHLIAATLADSLGVAEEVSVLDDEFHTKLC